MFKGVAKKFFALICLIVLFLGVSFSYTPAVSAQATCVTAHKVTKVHNNKVAQSKEVNGNHMQCGNTPKEAKEKMESSLEKQENKKPNSKIFETCNLKQPTNGCIYFKPFREG